MKRIFNKELQVDNDNKTNIEVYSRAECCAAFGVNDSRDNISTIEQLIEKVPEETVIVFDEVPIETMNRSTRNSINTKPSYDWSRLTNNRPDDVSVVVCLQPVSQTPTKLHRSRAIIGPEKADVIQLTRQYRSTKELSNCVNALLEEGFPIEYSNVSAEPAHDFQGPKPTY